MSFVCENMFGWCFPWLREICFRLQWISFDGQREVALIATKGVRHVSWRCPHIRTDVNTVAYATQTFSMNLNVSRWYETPLKTFFVMNLLSRVSDITVRWHVYTCCDYINKIGWNCLIDHSKARVDAAKKGKKESKSNTTQVQQWIGRTHGKENKRFIPNKPGRIDGCANVRTCAQIKRPISMPATHSSLFYHFGNTRSKSLSLIRSTDQVFPSTFTLNRDQSWSQEHCSTYKTC